MWFAYYQAKVLSGFIPNEQYRINCKYILLLLFLWCIPYFFDTNIICKHVPTIQYINQSQSFYHISTNYQSTYVWIHHQPFSTSEICHALYWRHQYCVIGLSTDSQYVEYRNSIHSLLVVHSWTTSLLLISVSRS